MRKVAVAVVTILALLVVGALVVPRVIGWHRFEHHIAQAVRDATGREIRIDGEIDIALLPAITFSVRDVRLANPPGFATPDMISIDSIEGRVQVWPFFGRRIVVERLVVQGLDVALEVDESGQENWLVEPATTPSQPDEAEEDDDGLPIADLRLEDVRIVGGAFSYRNAVTDQELIGRDLDLAVWLDALDAPLDIRGRWALNDQPVALVASIFPLKAVLSADPGWLALSLETTHLTARLDAGMQAEPLFGLDGQASIDVPSIGDLAAWLDVPYDIDPGPLRVGARFDSDGPKVALKEALIEGDRLSVRVSASLELGDDTTRIAAKVESGVLDIDRYLPPATPNAATPAPEPAADDAEDDDPLDMLPDTVLDLGGLRRLIANVDLAIDGVQMAGYTAGPIRLMATAKDGVIAADLDELGLYGGTIGGSLRLDASADTLAARTNLIIAGVDLGALARVTAGDAPPVVGMASGRLLAKTSGRTPRELTRNTIGEIDASLRSAGGPTIAGQLTALSLAFERPSVDANGRLRGSAVYGGEEIAFDIQTDRPIETLLLGDTIAVDFEVDSDVLTTTYSGRVVSTPVASLDGEWRAEIPSVAAFAAWLGEPLQEGRADPGAIQAYARLESDGRIGAIEEATIQGEGLDVRATGSFDATDEVLKFDLVVEGGTLDLDRYLPAGGGDGAGSSAADDGKGQGGGGGDPLAALSDQPFDLSPLRAQQGRVAVALDGIRVAGIEFGAIGLEGTLEDGKLAIELERLAFADGTITAQLDVDGSGDALVVDGALQVAGIRPTQLDALLSGTGITMDGPASAELKLSGKGGSLRQLATGTMATVQLDLPEVILDEGPIATIAAIDATVEVAGVDTGPRVAATTTLQPRTGGDAVEIDLKAQMGPLPELLAGAQVPLDVIAQIGTMTLQIAGQVAGLDDTPRPDLEIQIGGKQLKDLDALTGAELPDLAPYSMAARVTSEGQLYRITELATRLGRSDLGGEITVDLGGERPRLTADLRGDLLDVAELTGQRAADQAASTDAAATDQAAEPGTAEPSDAADAEPAPRLFPDDPLPLDMLRTLDAEITLAVAKLQTHRGAEVDDMKAQFELSDGDLRLAPFTGNSTGGDFEINLDLRTNQRLPEFELDYQAKGILVGTFVDLIRASGNTVGRADIDVQLTGSGHSAHAIAASLDGRVKVIGEGGSVDSAIMRMLSVGLGDLFSVFGEGKENTYLNCFVLNFGFEDGIGTADDFLVDFPAMSLVGLGSIDLGEELVDLQFNPQSKNASFVSFAVPFDVNGPLAAPTIRPDAAGTGFQMLKGVGLAALYLNPISVIPMTAATVALVGGDMIQTAGGNPCVVALRRAEAVGEAEPDESWFDRLKEIVGAD